MLKANHICLQSVVLGNVYMKPYGWMRPLCTYSWIHSCLALSYRTRPAPKRVEIPAATELSLPMRTVVS